MKLKHIWPPSALQWVTLVVIVYFATVALAFYEIEPCNGAGGFLAALSCLEANEFGDLLAGLFAPLAFIGLGYAIYIQSQELRAQRQELAATREEFYLNRKVSEQNVALVERQVQFVQEAERRAKTASADITFVAKVRGIVKLLRMIFENGIPEIKISDDSILILPFTPVNAVDDKEFIQEVLDAVSIVEVTVRERGLNKENIKQFGGVNLYLELERVIDELDELIEIRENTSTAIESEYIDISFEYIRDEIYSLYSLHPGVPRSS